MCSCLTGRPKLQSRIKKLHRRSCLQKIEIFLTLGKTGPDVVLPLSQSWAPPWPVPKRSPEGPRGAAAGDLTLQAGGQRQGSSIYTTVKIVQKAPGRAVVVPQVSSEQGAARPRWVPGGFSPPRHAGTCHRLPKGAFVSPRPTKPPSDGVFNPKAQGNGGLVVLRFGVGTQQPRLPKAEHEAGSSPQPPGTTGPARGHKSLGIGHPGGDRAPPR